MLASAGMRRQFLGRIAEGLGHGADAGVLARQPAAGHGAYFDSTTFSILSAMRSPVLIDRLIVLHVRSSHSADGTSSVACRSQPTPLATASPKYRRWKYSATFTRPISTGTSTSGPMTAAKAAP